MLHGGEIYDKKIEYDFSVNLNPYPCPMEVKSAINEAIKDIDKYPDMSQRKFRKAVSDAENEYLKKCYDLEKSITPDMVIGGNGASELIFSIVRMINPKKVLIPVPSFYGYRHALNENIFVNEYLLRKENDFALTEKFADEITCDTDLVIIANPNNPTGKCIDGNMLGAIVKRCNETNTALLIDECFLRLSDGNVSALGFINECNRLFVVSAYTKLFSVPGVRLGYVVSSEKNIDKLRRFLPEWNLSVFAERVGIACAGILTGSDFEEKSKALIREERVNLTGALREKGIRVYPSDANYILVHSKSDLYELLLGKGFLIRDCSNFKGLSKGFYRIAVKDKEANREFINALNAIV
ncbi:pyridoxal phosphate-dependent aminotransferase [Butyrivibrio sp. VCD2006]|uniref:pyridoxal phosphate-dependent aminotransferase n=1 Tax=Butyrivibrio sp. VCD2006 TaxID=1280664 RepID=UPI0003F96A9E|nr:aminotransferase class I/II-fold pyridoxal phosphate-dependent enzyme [Butyrivibrio sp. VCD2006]